MVVRSIRGFMGVAAAVLLAACASGRGDAVKSSPDSSRSSKEGLAGGSRMCEPGCGKNESCVEGRCICQAATCSSLGVRCGTAEDGCGGVLQCGECRPACGEDELECCGACIPKTNKRCPDNVHCPQPAQVE